MSLENLHVSLKADVIGNIGGFPVTNTFVTSIIAAIVLSIIAIVFSRGISLIPSRFQLLVEFMTSGAREYVGEVLENEKVAKKVFPLILSLFVFILFINLFKFLPGTESIKYAGVNFLKPAHSDLNMTIALGLVSFIVVQVFGVTVLGF
jgi:F-type H+-transporting ATPase subunit a